MAGTPQIKTVHVGEIIYVHGTAFMLTSFALEYENPPYAVLTSIDEMKAQMDSVEEKPDGTP